MRTKWIWCAVAALAVLAGGCGGGGNTIPHVPASVARDCTKVRIPVPASRVAGEYIPEAQTSVNCIQITTLVNSAEMGVVTSGVTVNEGTTKQFFAALFDPVCNVVSPAMEGFEWTVSGDIGTIDEAGLFTPASVSSSVSGSVAVTYKGFHDTVSVTVSPAGAQAACSSAAASSVATARNSLFKQTISETDFNTAKSAVASALADSPDCADANFLASIVDVVDEMERVGTDVMADPTTVFPFTVDYVADEPIGRVVAPVLRGLPVVSRTLYSDSAPSEYQAEIGETTIYVLEGALEKLNLARQAAHSQQAWSFDYPKDPANPQLGDESLDANDIDLFTGALEIVVGFVYYALAYNLDLPSGYAATDPCPEENCRYDYQLWTVVCETDDSYAALAMTNTCEDADKNGDGVLTPSEYFPPSPFGTVRAGGTAYLGYAQIHVATGFSLINNALDKILDEAEATIGGMAVGTSMLADAKHYQHYFTEVAQSFSGSTTDITAPPIVDCWRFNGYSYYNSEVLDPAYNSSELSNCVTRATSTQEITYTVNFGAMFSITDFRNVLPNMTIDDYGDTSYPSSSIIGNTFGGMFPGGVQSEWFDSKTVSLYVYLNDIKNSSTGSIISSLPQSGITLTVGTKTFTPAYVYSGTGYNYIDFMAPDLVAAPGESDYYTINDYLGVTATLSVPGYKSKTFTMYGSSYNSYSMTLTPQ